MGGKRSLSSTLFYFKGIPWRYSERGGGCTVEAVGENQPRNLSSSEQSALGGLLDPKKGTALKTRLFPGSRDAALHGVLKTHFTFTSNLMRNDLSCPMSVFLSVVRSTWEWIQ